MRRLMLGLVVLAIALACSNTSSPTLRSPLPTSQLHFVLEDSTAPLLLSDSAAFYAVKGQDRTVGLYYKNPITGGAGEEFLIFTVPADGLLYRPDGSGFLTGDSVQITVKVVDPKKFDFAFQPSGLQFSPDHPAELVIKYNHANHDFNGDGKIDSIDARIETQLDIWQRRPPDSVWYRLGAANYELLEELDALIPHFTDHAIAW